MKITILNDYNAMISKGIKANEFVVSRNSYLKFRVSHIDKEGLALCYRKNENNEIEHQWFFPSEIDLV